MMTGMVMMMMMMIMMMLMMVRMMVGKNSIFSCRAVQSLLFLPLSVAGPGGAVSYRTGNRQLGRSSIARPTARTSVN